MLSSHRIGVIGAGVMGQAMINGMISAGLVKPEQLWASVRSEASLARVQQGSPVRVVRDFSAEISQTTIFLICTKPRYVGPVLETLKNSGQLNSDSLIISIAAGVTISRIQQIIGPSSPVIRAMPNTPCQINEGITVISPAAGVTEAQRQLAKSIFSGVGKVIELEEIHMDAVTAVSGSGPAYIFLMMEALADGAVRVGIPRDVALQLVSQTVLGSAKMLQQSGKHPAALKDDVTTPSGTTIAALLTMEDGKIRSVLARAVEEATRTARGLADPYKKD
ncbi:MAG: pyrroline-5-carboxylate reductase [Bacteroidetes bacterium]|nr:pyrroline-5-carboxylate reductase [Bacteroidota bacterium]